MSWSPAVLQNTVWPFMVWSLTDANPVLRAAGPGDAPALAELHRAEFPRGWSAAEIAALAAEPGAAAVAAWRGGRLAGFALGRTAADEAEILTLVVARGTRRRGIGASLLAALEQACREQGARALFLEVSERNAPALALYYRGDYHQVGRRENYYGVGESALNLRKTLPDGRDA